MNKKVDDKYCFKTTYKNGEDSFGIYGIKSKDDKSNKCVIFIPGLNGNGAMINYWDYPILDTHYLFSFDPRAQADNKCKPSRLYRTYVNDIHNIINFIKKEYNISEVYLIGESWGGALCSLYVKYYDDVKGFFSWNVPYKIVDVSSEKGKEKLVKTLKMILTFLTNIDTYDNGRFVDKLTNDEVLIRIVKALRRNRVSNRVIIAAWRSFKSSWKFIEKNLDTLNFRYIQSLQDVMGSIDKVKQMSKKTSKIKIFDQGYHILSFDKNMSDELFSEINKFVK